MKNEQWEGTPAEYLKKILKEKQAIENVKNILQKNK